MPIGVNNDTGDFTSLTGVDTALNEANHYSYDPTVYYEGQFDRDDEDAFDDSTPKDSPSFLGTLVDNFIDSVTNTGFANVAQVIWGHLFHTESLFSRKPLDKEDIDYVKTALADDEDAQNFVLSHAEDGVNARWLVNQKLVDKRRQQEVEQWRAGNQGIVSRFAMGTAGALGYVLDPLNLIPVSKAVTGLKMIERLDKGLTNVAKAKEIASYATKVGVTNSAIVATDDYMRSNAGGQKVDYGADAAVGFLVGATLGATGGLFKTYTRGNLASEVANELDVLETRAYEHAAGIKHVSERKPITDTYSDVIKHHQPEFADTVKSKMYDSFVENKRVVAAPSDVIRNLVRDKSGIEVPQGARALYVPNEDYAIIFTDKVKPHEVEPILTHEFGVHAGLQKAMGTKAYDRLMNNVSKWAGREGVWNTARSNADTYDPEEILAKVIEDGNLDESVWETIKGAMNDVLKKDGSEIRLKMKDVKSIMEEQSRLQKNPLGYYENPDGSTSFAGLRYSKDNMLNPANLAKFYELEQNIRRDTQKDVFNHLPDIIADPLRKVTQGLEQGIFGEGINSPSNIVRRYTSQIWQDPRGRGLGNVATITAEENKQRINNSLFREYEKFADIRLSWCNANREAGRAGHQLFNKMVAEAYNYKYAGHTSTPLGEVPPEVWKAAEQYKRLRERMEELGKTSSDDVAGHPDRNLIDKDWYPVDHEVHRQVDKDALVTFKRQFLHGDDEMLDFLEDYIRKACTPAKKEVIRQKLKREIVMENKKIEKANNNIPEGSKRKPKELLPVKVSDEEVEKFIDEHARDTAVGWVSDVLDMADPANIRGSRLGDLNFLRTRMPIDTSMIVKMPDGVTEFSFDNNLRSFDMDDYVLKSINRFAGEAALKNVFPNQKALDEFLDRAQIELKKAHQENKIKKSTYQAEFKHLKDAIAEFRGSKSPDEVGVGRAGAVAKIFRNLAYVKNGANMGFNQIGEAGGTIAYGGVSQLFRLFAPLGRFVENVKHGKVSAQTLRDAEDYIFGSTIERDIWNMNYGDRMIRDALTSDNIVDKTLVSLADFTANLGKITSSVNLLPKMTDSMVRGMRIQTMMDSIRVARGEKVGSIIRNPFSKAKLKAAHISKEQFEVIKKRLNEYTTVKDGQVTSFDYQKWQQEDTNSFLRWYGLIQNQAERGIVSATKQGNKNILKNSSQFWQIFFQFKDYNLRAINAQTFRTMTAGDVDDAIATGLSVVMNMAAYAARVGLTVGALKASGADKKAIDYYNSMFDDDTLKRMTATRSTILGSPLSFINDAYEAATGATSVRTTVTRQKSKRERNSSDIIGDVIAQLPAVREMSNYTLDVIRAFNHASEDKFRKKDFANMMRLIPMPNMIPFYSYTQSLLEHSNLK